MQAVQALIIKKGRELKLRKDDFARFALAVSRGKQYNSLQRFKSN